MAIKRNRRTLLSGAAVGALLLGGSIVGCAPDSLALHAAATSTPATAPSSSASVGANTGIAAVAPVNSSASFVRAAPIATPATATSGVPHSIAVSGTGQIQAKPDEAIVGAGVQTEATSAQDAQAANNKAMQAVIAAIKAVGIPAKDIQTTGVSLYPVTDRDNKVTGYRATNNVNVTVEKIDQAGAVLDAAVKAGANTANNVSFTFKDETSLRNQALAAAAADAQSKANALAKALNLHITGVESVNAGAVDIPRPFIEKAAAPAAMASAGSAVPIEPGQQTITATVTIVFGY